MPKEGSKQFFKNYYRSQTVPFVVYADFESFTIPIQTNQPNLEGSYTKKYQKHEPSGFCYYIKCFDDSIYKQDPVIYTKQNENEDISQIFVETLEKNIREIYKKFWDIKNNKYVWVGNVTFTTRRKRDVYKKATQLSYLQGFTYSK